jgi:hypothetical protein
MKNVIRDMMVISALACAVSMNAQTADEIVSKHLAAIGGKEAISQVKSISMETTVQVMGNDAPSTTQILDGVGYKTETDFNGTKIVSCLNDKGGWRVNPMAGTSDPAAMPDDEYNAGKSQIYIGGALYDYAAKGNKIELFGKDATTYTIKVTTKENAQSTYVIDSTTYLIKTLTSTGKMQGQDVQVTTSFSDYRKTDAGYVMPYGMSVDIGGQFSLNITVKKVEVNKTIDPAIFAMPKISK